MKQIYIIIYVAMTLAACSIDEVLKPSNQINISLMETVDTVKAVPGADIQFKFIASTNFGKIIRIEVDEKSHPFEISLDSINFTLVDQSLGLSLDSSGFLSRPVSTVMVLLPMTVPLEEEYVGETLSMRFKVSDDQGNTASVRPCFKIVNIKSNDWLYLYMTYAGRASFYAFDSNGKHAKYLTFSGEEESIEIITATDADKKTYAFNPHASATEEFMITTTSYKTYKSESMRNTVFMKLEACDFDRIDDTFVEQLDFSQAVDRLEINHKDVFAFKNQDGKKGIIQAQLQYNQLSLRSLIQIVAK